MKYFTEIDLNLVKDKDVILDIDGNILEDKGHSIDEKNRQKVLEIKEQARSICFISNGDKERSAKLASELSVKYIDTNHKKPSRYALGDFSGDLVVIGDKFITDGIFALKIGAKFIHTKSVHSKSESLMNKIIYILDDILGQSFEFLKLIRPKQWIKNSLVFSPIFFAGQFFDKEILLSGFLAFCAFTASASLVYILNDFVDVENDKLHHKKKWRPLAASNISNSFLFFATAILILLLSSVLYLLPSIIWLILIYIFANILYTFKFKTVPVYDICIVAFMYVLRILLGGVATNIYVSPWLAISVFFSALFMISAKRYAEMQNPARLVLKHYSKESLGAILIASSSLSLATYTIYSIIISKNNFSIYSCMLATAIFFVTLNDIFTGNKKIESPEIYFLTNKKIIFLIGVWFLYEIVVLYFI